MPTASVTTLCLLTHGVYLRPLCSECQHTCNHRDKPTCIPVGTLSVRRGPLLGRRFPLAKQSAHFTLLDSQTCSQYSRANKVQDLNHSKEWKTCQRWYFMALNCGNPCVASRNLLPNKGPRRTLNVPTGMLACLFLISSPSVPLKLNAYVFNQKLYNWLIEAQI